MKDPSTTARPMIVLVSVPERRRDSEKDRQKFATKDALLRHVQNDVPNIDYMKTVHKGTDASEMRTNIFVLFFIQCSIIRCLIKHCCFLLLDRRYSDINADSVGHRFDRRRRDRFSWSDFARGGYGPSHAHQIIRDHSSCRLRRRENQGPRTGEREERKDVRDGKHYTAP